MIMRMRKIPFMLYSMRFPLVFLVLVGSFIFPLSHLVYAHTFSTSESAEFLSLTDQIRAETALVTINLKNNNATLAQAHAEKASSLLDNNTLSEVREKNNRIANSLESGLEQLVGNVTSPLASTSLGQMPQDRIQSTNQAVMSLNDIMAEAVTARVESEQQNNVTTWAMVLADLVNVVLSDFGNATGSSFDLTDISNIAQANATSSTSNMTTTTTTIVDTAAYQSAQYLVNNTILQLFNDTLKPLTMSSNGASSDNNNATSITQGGQDTSPAAGNMTSDIDQLEANLLQLKDDINGKATPNEVMVTAHLNIHPLLMQSYGLTLEQEEEEEHDSDHGEVQ
jgi:phage FluMu protein gp41